MTNRKHDSYQAPANVVFFCYRQGVLCTSADEKVSREGISSWDDEEIIWD